MGNEPFPPAMRSRISPPVPVDAPLKGSTVVGKLCVSAFSERTDCNVFNLEEVSLVLRCGSKLFNYRTAQKCAVVFVG